jgi:hypothetical protein
MRLAIGHDRLETAARSVWPNASTRWKESEYECGRTRPVCWMWRRVLSLRAAPLGEDFGSVSSSPFASRSGYCAYGLGDEARLAAQIMPARVREGRRSLTPPLGRDDGEAAATPSGR